MQESKTVTVTPTTKGSNGQPPPIPPLVSQTLAQRSVKPTIWGRIFETVAAAAFVGCILVIGLNFESWFWILVLLLLLTALGVTFLNLAWRQAKHAALREQKLRADRKYRLTSRRLKILEEIGVPDDIIDALSGLLGRQSLSEDDFFEKIAKDLGQDRANEFRETILKYTETDTSPASAANSPKNTTSKLIAPNNVNTH